jgi:deoxyribodipyrimidine photolyase-related protein
MTRHLILVLGDQLGWDNPALADFDPTQDRLLMIEADSEAGEVWNHKSRIAIFLSGMRHFANVAHQRRWPCTYMKVDDAELLPDFAGRLALALHTDPPKALVVMEAGAWRMERLIEDAAEQAQVLLRWVADTHFLCGRAAKSPSGANGTTTPRTAKALARKARAPYPHPRTLRPTASRKT